MDCPGTRALCMTNFVTWSSTTSNALKPSQMPRLRMGTLLARPIEICRAAAADFRVFRVMADVGPIMPAALAFPLFARTNDDLLNSMHNFRLGRVEDETKIVTERVKQRIPIACSVNFDFSL